MVLEGKKKYDEFYEKVKANRKQSPPTFNQELLKIYQLRQKKESGRRKRDCLLEQNRKQAYQCIDEINDSDTDDDDHNIALWTIPTTLQAISQISLLPQWCSITLAICIAMSRKNQCRIADNKVIHHKYPSSNT